MAPTLDVFVLLKFLSPRIFQETAETSTSELVAFEKEITCYSLRDIVDEL